MEFICSKRKTRFSLRAFITVDEQLVPFKGRCFFTQYMPSKSAKYGINFFWSCNASLLHAFNAKIYVARQPGSIPQKIFGQNVVVHLTAPLQDSGRNASMDNFFYKCFSGESVASTLIRCCWDYEKMQQKILECMKDAKSRQIKTSAFGFNDEITMSAMFPKRIKL